MLAAGQAQAQVQRESQAGGTGSTAYTVDVAIERKRAGKPHQGKVLAAIQPHCDDVPIFAGGTVLKLIDEGYTGVLITMSNDSMAGTGSSIGDIVLKNERDTTEAARRMGLKEAIFLNYPNHNMDGWPILEMRARLVFLFRLLKVDTVLVYDPSALYERNPDHYVTARAVESACWTAASEWDYPEHFKAGLTPHGPSEKYYFARGPQLVNRVVDIGPWVPQKVGAIESCETMITHMVKDLNDSLAERGLRVPNLTGAKETAAQEFIQAAFVTRDRATGGKYGLASAEEFHYIGPDASLDDYITRNAQRI